MGGERGGVGKGSGGGGVRRRPESARVFGERGSKRHWTDGSTNKFTLRLSPYSAGTYRCVIVCVCVCGGGGAERYTCNDTHSTLLACFRFLVRVNMLQGSRARSCVCVYVCVCVCVCARAKGPHPPL
jgi:hypothetical protein